MKTSRIGMILIAAVLMCGHAFATVKPSAPTAATASANADATADSHATATGGNGTGGESTATVNNVNKVARQAPDVFSAGTNNNVPCHGEWHVGLGVPGAGLGGGRDRKDKDCLRKTAADELYDRGNYVAAAKLYCKVRYYAEALGEECETLMALPPSRLSVANAGWAVDTITGQVGTGFTSSTEPSCFTRDELKERDKRCLEVATGK